MTSGKIRLIVGNRSIHYHKKINDNHWHKVDLSVEKHSFHLLVDNLRVTDGQLPAGEGAALTLSSPVYLGADLTTPNTEAQRKSVPRASVTGCIYNFKFYNELVGEPLTKAGISPCFDSKMGQGSFSLVKELTWLPVSVFFFYI
ncbi:laminin subunit alpha-3-like [Clupea harengus]|uniref:Laminin subunit alpha-3-like n=1 Tax=Clupea harengus TaxID=7950 RepID=A0A6P8EUH1_CLUHA|nr:laminin subunit alpha-3-like [Clupea harengus]